MISYSEDEVNKLLESRVSWGYIREYIKKDESIQQLAFRMLQRERKSFHTLRRYLEGVQKFVDYMKAQTPSEALNKVKLAEDPAEIVDAYIDYLVSKGMTPINIKAHFFGVKKWLIENRVKVDWEFISKPKAATRIRDRIPSREELRRIINMANLRDKALFMTAFSSGLRAGTLLKLKVKDYKPIEDLAMIEVEGGEGKKLSEDKFYFTFVTPETRKVIEDYLATRNITPESPLFSRVDVEAPFDTYTSNLSRQWRKLVKRAKLSAKIMNHSWIELHLHVLRKFFQTTCKMSGIAPDFYDFWLGHISSKKEQYLNDSYFRASIEQHLAQYRKAISSLTIFSTIDEDLKKKLEEMEQWKASIERTINDKEIIDLEYKRLVIDRYKQAEAKKKE